MKNESRAIGIATAVGQVLTVGLLSLLLFIVTDGFDRPEPIDIHHSCSAKFTHGECTFTNVWDETASSVCFRLKLSNVKSGATITGPPLCSGVLKPRTTVFAQGNWDGAVAELCEKDARFDWDACVLELEKM